MKAAIIVSLAVAVCGKASPYTLAQVAAGQTAGGVITGVDYGHGLVSGVGALGTGRFLAHAAVPAAHQGVAPVSAYSAYPSAYSAYPSAYSAYPSAYSAYPSAYSAYPSAYPYHAYAKREAEAEPWTVDQIAHGAHIAEAIKDGRPHNVGVITNANIVPAVAPRAAYSAYSAYSTYPYAGVYSAASAAPAHAAYSAYPYASYPYNSAGVYAAAPHAGVYAAAPHAVAATPFGLTHSSNVGVCTNYLGVQVPC